MICLKVEPFLGESLLESFATRGPFWFSTRLRSTRQLCNISFFPLFHSPKFIQRNLRSRLKTTFMTLIRAHKLFSEGFPAVDSQLETALWRSSTARFDPNEPTLLKGSYLSQRCEIAGLMGIPNI